MSSALGRSKRFVQNCRGFKGGGATLTPNLQAIPPKLQQTGVQPTPQLGSMGQPTPQLNTVGQQIQQLLMMQESFAKDFAAAQAQHQLRQQQDLKAQHDGLAEQLRTSQEKHQREQKVAQEAAQEQLKVDHCHWLQSQMQVQQRLQAHVKEAERKLEEKLKGMNHKSPQEQLNSTGATHQEQPHSHVEEQPSSPVCDTDPFFVTNNPTLEVTCGCP